MDLIDHLQAIAARAEKYADRLDTEEATKMTLVVPFIKALGYDPYNPDEVEPEFTADVGTKKGEKVDYAIKRDDKPIIVIECKKVGVDLEKDPASQLYRYFSVTDARVAILTDGLRYRFFSDLEARNKMDKHPFLEFDIREVNEAIAKELRGFASGAFDIDTLLAAAEEIKYTRAIRKFLVSEFATPSEDLVKWLTKQVYTGTFSKSVKEKFQVIVKRALREFINDRIDHRLVAAKRLEEAEPSEVEPTPASAAEADAETLLALPDGVVRMDGDVVTTTEELEGFLVVKAIVRQVIDPERVHMRDTKSYCGVLLDNNNRRPICRLRFNGKTQLYLGLFDALKNETRMPIASVDDIYQHAEALRATVLSYEGRAADPVQSSPAGGEG